jgi:protochlorophyllide reductase
MKSLLLILLMQATATYAFKALGSIKVKLPSLGDFSPSKFGPKKLVVITGASSGLGRSTVRQLLKRGGYHVIAGVRDIDKMNVVADIDEMDKKSLTIMPLDLANFDSVNKFVDDVKTFKGNKPLDRLVCNAAVYQPTLDVPQWSDDGIEQQLQINHLSHFLMISKFIEDMKEAPGARVITVGSVTGNDNTVGGGGVYPIADLRELEGFEAIAEGERFNPSVCMADGYSFNGAKGYKDSKMAIMMTSNLLHEKYHRSTGIAFSSIYPGCIAESPLFREKRPWFRKYFPVFMKYITGGFVGEEEAGSRLLQVIVDPRASRSGVYWSWNGGPRQGRGAEALEQDGNIIGAGGAGGDWDSIFENEQSDKVRDMEKATELFKYSTEITSAEWPQTKSTVSPCPTLVVIGAVTNMLDKLEQSGKGSGIATQKKRPKSMEEAMDIFNKPKAPKKAPIVRTVVTSQQGPGDLRVV